jgi:hypothetical protein
MSNKNIKSSTVTAGLLVFCGFFLTSCGESTNIQSSNNGAATTKCSDLGVDCVAGRFVDDSVYNLNYTCGAVTAITDFDGSFACPLTSQVRFSIKNPVNGLEIEIGTTTVKNVPQTGVADYFYVTPKTLTGDATAQKNIVRLLQSLSRDTVPLGSPDHLVILDDADKKKISFAVAATDFSKSPAAFALFMKPYLDSLSPAVTLISDTDAERYLSNGIYSTMAGVYSVPGLSVGFSDPALIARSGGMVGENSTNRLIGTFWAIVDRKGRLLGGGAYSFEAKSASSQFIYTNTKAMEFSSFGTPSTEGFYYWPVNGDLTGFFFKLKDDTNAATTRTLAITSGTLDRGVVAGSNEVYKSYFGDATAPTVGRWQFNDATVPGNDITSANATVAPAYTLIRNVPAAPTLDPDSWERVRASFPLNVAINFYDSDTAIDDGSGNKGALINTAPVRITVLSDGNIVSDKNGDCNADIDLNTLKDSHGQQEVPLGLVQNIFTLSSGKSYMTIIMMLPNTADYDADLRYAQVLTNLSGSSSGAQPVLLRVDGSAATNTEYLALTDYQYSAKKAPWYNAWKSYRNIGGDTTVAKRMQGRMTSSAVPAADCI